MRFFISLAATLILIVLSLAACRNLNTNRSSSTGNSQATPHSASRDEIKRVTIGELRDALEQGTAVVYDVRGEDAYNASHIKGALPLLESQISSRTKEFPKDKLIVLYCS